MNVMRKLQNQLHFLILKKLKSNLSFHQIFLKSIFVNLVYYLKTVKNERGTLCTKWKKKIKLIKNYLMVLTSLS